MGKRIGIASGEDTGCAEENAVMPRYIEMHITLLGAKTTALPSGQRIRLENVRL